jgi:hypothetical protein
LLTDDMLVVTSLGGTFLAHPGPPRIKLYRDIATRTLGGAGHGIPMNAETEKLIFPLAQGVPRPAPLETIYLLAEDHGRGEGHPATIRRLSPAAACPRILAGTAAHWAEEPTRLAHQFEFVTRLVERVPVKTLSYRRSQDDMFGVREAVLADLTRQGV